MMGLIGKWWLRSAFRKSGATWRMQCTAGGGGVGAAIPREASRWYGSRSQWHSSGEECGVVDGVCVCVCVCVCVSIGYAYV